MMRLVPILSLVAGLAMAGAAAFVGDAKTAWFLAAIGIAALVLSVCAFQGKPVFGALAAALLAGGAAELWLTEPLWFPSLRLRPGGLMDLVAGAMLAGQAALVVVVLWRIGLTTGLSRLNQSLGVFRTVILLALTGLLSVSVMGFLGEGRMLVYGVNLFVSGVLAVLNVLTVLALAAVPHPATRLSRPMATPLFLAAVAFVSAATMSFFAFERMPHVEDEVVYLFQATLLAAGQLTAPAPPEAAQAALDYYLMAVEDGRWVMVTSPGWPAVLALGVLAGVPWLVNPVLSALGVLLGHAVASRLWDRDRADVVALLLAISPWLMAMSGSFMTHPLSLVLILLAWWCLLRWPTAPVAALGAGLAMGWLFVNRPLEGVLIGMMTGLWILIWGGAGRWPRAIAFGVGCIVTGLAFFGYNWAITGAPLSAPLADYLNREWGEGANAFGFGAAIGPPGGWGALDLWPGHSPVEGMVNTANNLAILDMDLFGWGLGSLLVVMTALLWKRLDRPELAMLAIVVAVIGLHGFYWFTGSYFIGPRYWFAAFFPLVALTAAGIAELSRRAGTVRVAPILAILCLFSIAVYAPWRGVVKYHDYGGYNASVRAQLGDIPADALVFVTTELDIGSALVLNDPWLREDRPVFVPDLGEEANATTASAFPDRPVVRITAP